MEKERSGVGEYTYQLLDRWFKEVYEKKLDHEFFLFWNSFHNVRANLPQWNYPFVHYRGHRWPNKLLNVCLKVLRYPKLDKMLVPKNLPIGKFFGTRGIGKKIDYFVFPNQNFYALSKGVKKIVVVHDLSPELYHECFSLKQRLWHKAVNLRVTVHGADQIIAVSENTKRDLVSIYKVDPNKIVVMYPHHSEHRYPFANSRELANDKEDVKYILFLGTIEPRKNVLGLLRAYDRLHEDQREIRVTDPRADQRFPELWIAGKAGYKSKEVFKYWKNMKARDRVKFLGYVDEKKKLELLRSAKIFVYPSRYEGFGMPVLEAMSAGAPVITSWTSSMHEIVGDAGILVDPNRVDEIAQAIKLLADNDALSEALNKASMQRAMSVQSKIIPANLFS